MACFVLLIFFYFFLQSSGLLKIRSSYFLFVTARFLYAKTVFFLIGDVKP